ncbi:MAG: BlaI/MecI/CopY family transcriptional regulator [Acidimicrobiia bacterium]|nr:BlaI/MecI/CopY family transcriptional regulator [Acidimicrobiia bacterium]
MSAAPFSRRERQIMDVLFRLGKATAAQVRAAIPDPPSYSAVRAHLRTLEDKGHVRHKAEELRYVYMPAQNPEKARRGALRHLVDTFFPGSPATAVAALLSAHSSELSGRDLDELQTLIDQAREEGR